MFRFRLKIFSIFNKLIIQIRRRYELIKITFYSLFYNEHVNLSYAIDTLMEPLFWFVDHFTGVLGPIFVVMVITVLSIYILIAYAIGLPYWINKSYIITLIALIIGNWLVMNVAFHYYMALTTPPGYPPEDRIIDEAVSICKKCIAPKPPRTHHCSVCNKCILKMDHHCPWINNCVGFFNHRYFFMFCFYTWIGCIFVIIFGVTIAYEHYFGENGFWYESNNLPSVTSMESATFISASLPQSQAVLTSSSQTPSSSSLSFDPIEEISVSKSKIINEFMLNSFDYAYVSLVKIKHTCILFEILITAGAFVAVGALMAFHAKLITNGETCIESHINKKERERNKNYINPYTRSPRRNWLIFLGLNKAQRTFAKHVLLPSAHSPDGDGLHWPMVS